MPGMADEDDWAALVHVERSVGQLRIKAHDAFDPIWRSGAVRRGQAYQMLADELGIPEHEAHFKRMSVEELETALPVIAKLREQIGI